MSRQLIEYVAPWLLDHPEDVTIEEVEGERGETVLEVSVHPEDVGKIIGRRGRIVGSLRALARAASQRDGETVLLEVVD
jgi:predicted RNA-binding protein YlqC (UPF0109 family)